MGMAEAVAVLQAHVAVARVAQEACHRVAALCLEEGNRQPAADAGALEAVVAAMWAHPHVAAMQARQHAAAVQEYGCRALNNVCAGSDAAGLARRQRAVAAGGREAATATMQAHPGHAQLQRAGQLVIDRLYSE